MPKVPMNPENEEAAVIPTSAESWRVPTEAIENAVNEAISGLVVGNGLVSFLREGATVASFHLNDATDTVIDLSQIGFEVDDKLSTTSTNPAQNKVITTELNKKANTAALAQVAFSGNYAHLSNTPVVDSELDNSSTNAIQNSVVAEAISQKADASSLAAVATSGSFNDLSDTPTIDTTLSTSSTNAIQNKAVATELNKKANDNSLATVAKTGKYTDLINTPTIGSGTLTIQKNESNVGTFSANATANSTINIPVPTAVTDLSDASDYAFAADLISLESSLATVATTGDYADLSNTPTVDASISQSSTNAIQNKAVHDALELKADATSIGNGTLTIKRNGTSVATFSANSSTAAEADISVPTAVSQLSDASSYYTKTQVDDAISGAVSASLKYKGSCTFANLPSSGMQVGDVWNITDDFTLDGEPYTAGTNVAWNGTKWDPLAPAIDLSPYALSSSIGNGTITIATTTANVDNFTTNQSASKTITIPAATASAHGTVIVDSALSASSDNPVRNSVIYAAIGDIETILNTLNSGTGA